MKKKSGFFPTFVFFLFLTIIILGLSRSPFFTDIRSVLEKITFPFQNISFSLFKNSSTAFKDQQLEKLKSENRDLIKELAGKKEIEKENNALKDQFKTTFPASQNLLPAKIIGFASFIPGITKPENLIIDKGKKSNLKQGQSVIFKNNLVGKIIEVSPNFSLVALLTNKSFSITAKTTEAEALGIIKGQGDGEMIFDNVLLTEKLKVPDLVLTKGDIDSKGIGNMPDLVIGKLTSIDKKSSELFQKASVKSLLDFTKLDLVFVVMAE